QTTLTFLHLAGIFLGGGFAIATDRETFIAMAARVSGQIRHLQHLHTVHRPVMLGLVIANSSGFLLFLADIETLTRSWVFWVKMTLLTLLLVHGYPPSPSSCCPLSNSWATRPSIPFQHGTEPVSTRIAP